MNGRNASMCPAHWAELRDEVKAQGLWEFVATSGEELARKMVASNQGPSRATFEPLMGAHMAILQNALQALGPFDGCPICISKRADWIKLAVADQLDDARDAGYLTQA